MLAVDTTAESGSIALVRAEGTIAESVLRAPDGHEHVLFDEIGELLERTGIRLHDIALFACSSGPGSFTGVRVGLTAVKGLAAVLGKPAIGVSNLRAMAALGHGALRAPILDARRGEIFGAVYDAEGSSVQGETVGSLREWLAAAPPNVTFVLKGASPFEASLPPQSHRVYTGNALAAAVGRIALSELSGGKTFHPGAVDANYVRRADAESKWTDR